MDVLPGIKIHPAHHAHTAGSQLLEVRTGGSVGTLVFGSDAYSSWQGIRDWMMANPQSSADTAQQFLAYEKCYKLTGNNMNNCIAAHEPTSYTKDYPITSNSWVGINGSRMAEITLAPGRELEEEVSCTRLADPAELGVRRRGVRMTPAPRVFWFLTTRSRVACLKPRSACALRRAAADLRAARGSARRARPQRLWRVVPLARLRRELAECRRRPVPRRGGVARDRSAPTPTICCWAPIPGCCESRNGGRSLGRADAPAQLFGAVFAVTFLPDGKRGALRDSGRRVPARRRPVAAGRGARRSRAGARTSRRAPRPGAST